MSEKIPPGIPPEEDQDGEPLRSAPESVELHLPTIAGQSEEYLSPTGVRIQEILSALEVEPTSALDRAIRDGLRNQLFSLNRDFVPDSEREEGLQYAVREYFKREPFQNGH